jgi:hypothetical protein
MIRTAVFVLTGTTLALAASSSLLDCFTGALADYLPISDYTPAQEFCSQEFPQAFSTRTTCASSPKSGAKRDMDHFEARNAYEAYNWDYLQQSTFESLTHQSQTIIEKVCHCIAFSSAATTTIACTFPEYCDSQTGTCQSRRNCRNPARCDASSLCFNANDEACFCHPDTDDPDSGYCLGDGPAGAPCPDVYEDCASNADCGEAGVCIYACCRDEPFCINPDEYGCANYRAPGKLFRRKSRVGMNEGMIFPEKERTGS